MLASEHHCWISDSDKRWTLTTRDLNRLDYIVGYLEPVDVLVLKDLDISLGFNKPISKRRIIAYKAHLRSQVKMLDEAFEVIKDMKDSARYSVEEALANNKIKLSWHGLKGTQYFIEREEKINWKARKISLDYHSSSLYLGTYWTWMTANKRGSFAQDILQLTINVLQKIERVGQLENIDYPLHLLSSNKYVRTSAEKLYRKKKVS